MRAMLKTGWSSPLTEVAVSSTADSSAISVPALLPVSFTAVNGAAIRLV